MKRFASHSRNLALASLVPFSLALGACVLERVDLCAEDPTRLGCEEDAGPDAPYGCAYGDPCPSHVPVCSQGLCVACDGNEDCTRFGEEYVCSPKGACVVCLDASACADNQACVAGKCAADCVAHVDCEGRPARPSCDVKTGDCVGCTPDSEELACGTKSCDPAMQLCGPYDRGARRACESCVSDSDCEDNYRCVPMFFADAPRAGGYCLQVTPGCAQPFSATLTNRTSLSGVSGLSYCGINEDVATCEAVRALLDNLFCEEDGFCRPAPDQPAVETPGAICRTVGDLLEPRCTYNCTGPLECASTPPAISTCGDGEANDGITYCGG